MPTIVEETIGTGEDYADLPAWEVATDNDHVAADEIRRGQIEEVDLNQNLVPAGSTTDATRYREITFGPVLGRYDPIADTGSGIDTTNDGVALQINEDNFHVTGIEVRNSNGPGGFCVRTFNAGMIVDGCTLRRVPGTGGGGAGLRTDTGGTGSTVRNTAFISDGIGLTSLDGINIFATDTIIENCSFYNHTGEGIVGDTVSTAARFQVINCVVMLSGSTDFVPNTAADSDFTFCLSEDSSASPFADSFDTETIADIFTDAGNDDLTLVGSGNAADNGSDLSGRFTNDLDNATRSVPWDMGCYDFVAPGDIAPIVTVARRRVLTGRLLSM